MTETTKEFTVKFDACVEGYVEQEIGFDHCETYKAHRADIERCVADTIDFLAPHWWRTDILAACTGYQGLPSSVGTIAGRCVKETLVGFFTLMFISSEIEYARAKLHGNPPPLYLVADANQSIASCASGKNGILVGVKSSTEGHNHIHDLPATIYCQRQGDAADG